jgi:nitronate monooxygenase
MTEMEQAGINVPDYTVQNSITGPIRAASQLQDNNQFTNMWSGQSAPKIHKQSSGDIFTELIRQAENIMPS